MRGWTLLSTLALLLCLLFPSGSSPAGPAKPQETVETSPAPGFRVEEIEQKRTDRISWLRVQVAADTGVAETWTALQAVEEWGKFLRIFSDVAVLERWGAMTRYRFSVSPPWPIGNFDSLIWISVLPEQRLMLWRSNRDDLTRSHGRIEVREMPEGTGTRVSYEMHSPAQGAFPPWVVRIGLYLVLPGVAQDFLDRIHGQDDQEGSFPGSSGVQDVHR
jgi:hypothetical protein